MSIKVKKPTFIEQQLRSQLEEVQRQLLRLQQGSACAVNRVEPPPKTRAVQLTEEIENANRKLSRDSEELSYLRNKVRDLELTIAADKLNTLTTQQSLKDELTAAVPLV